MKTIIYVGPMIPSIGLQRGALFMNGKLHPLHLETIKRCPSLGALFIPMAEYPAVRRELQFDLGRNMRGTGGRYVTFYREVENWLATRASDSKTSQPTGVQIKTHA